MTNARARQSLKGRYAVNGDNNKARIVDVFEIVRDGNSLTVALLRYDEEHDLAMRSITEMFGDFAIFWSEKDADRFIAGHRAPSGADDEASPAPDLAEAEHANSIPGEQKHALVKRRPRRGSH